MSQRPPSSKGSKKSGTPKVSFDPKPSAIATVGGAAPGIGGPGPGGPGGPGRPSGGSAPGGTAKKAPSDSSRKAPSDPAGRATSDAGRKGPSSRISEPAPVPRAPSKQASVASSKSTDDGYEQGEAAREARAGKLVARDTGYMPPPPTAEHSAPGSTYFEEAGTPAASYPPEPAAAGGRGKFVMGPLSEGETEYTHASDNERAAEFAVRLRGFHEEIDVIRRERNLQALPTATESDEILGREEKIRVPSRPSTREMVRAARGEKGSSIRSSSNDSSKASPINFNPDEPSTMSLYAKEEANDPRRRVLAAPPPQMALPGLTPFVHVQERSGKPATGQSTASSDLFEDQGRESMVSRPPARPQTPTSPLRLNKVSIPAVGKPVCRTASEQMAEELKDYRDILTDALTPAFRFCGPSGWSERSQNPANHHLPHPTTYEVALTLAQNVIDKLYAKEIVREYDRYVTETRGGQNGCWFKRLAEDDAVAGVVDKKRYPQWRELRGFLNWVMDRPEGIKRQKIFNIMTKDNVSFAVAEKRVNSAKTKEVWGLNAS